MKETNTTTEKIEKSSSANFRRGASAIVEQLKKAGLVGQPDTFIAGNPGSGEELLYIELTNEIQMGLAEPAVGSMVDGASRVHSKPAVAIAHGFVGFSGLQGDVFNAAQRQSPMLIIVGESDSQAHTGETHMYADIIGAAKAARCKYVKHATDSDTLLRDLRDCITQAMLPPFGPVVFIVGSDITKLPNHERVITPKLPNMRLSPPYEEIRSLAKELISHEKVGILIGDGISRSEAHKEMIKMAELLGAEVWASMESEINFPRNHYLFKGNLGHMDDERGRELLKHLDFVIAVGTPIYQTVYSSKKALLRPEVGLAAINHDIESIIRGHNDISHPVKGDPKQVVSLLVKAIKEVQPDEKATEIQKQNLVLKSERKKEQEEKRKELLKQSGITMAKFASTLEEKLSLMNERPIIFNEALVGGVGLTDFIKNIDFPGKYYDTSGGSLGEWAGGVGASFITGPTLVFIGDGGFHYAPQALWNAAKNKLPIGFVVANNASYGLLESNMENSLKKLNIDIHKIPHPHYYDLEDIDYVKIAEGYGVRGIRVDQEELIPKAVELITEFSAPFLIDLRLNN